MLAHCVWCAQDDSDLHAVVINNQWANVEVKHFQDSAGILTVRHDRGTPTDEKASSVN